MRIIAGRFRGHPLFSPVGRGARPTSDKARQALFNIIGPDIAGRSFLDLFAGTGAVGLEALSRGAAKVMAVESAQAELVIKNAAKLKAGPAEGHWLVRGDVFSTLDKIRAGGERFDYIFADPPWDAALEGRIVTLAAPLLAKDGLLILELNKRTTPPDGAPHGLSLYDSRGYGEAMFYFYLKLAWPEKSHT
jgi:16S rRNA (guanine(966)-N(2))-methyltransferase RsmD